MHAGEGTLQAYLDGEVRAADHAGVEAHVATCAPCRSELDTLRRSSADLHDALALLDVPAPMVRAAAAFEAARRPVTVSTHRDVGRWTRAGMLKAATLILALAGVASAAVPNSPLRRWVSGAWDRVSALFSQPELAQQEPAPAVIPPAPAPAAQEPVGGLTIRPDIDGNVRVVLESPAGDLGLVVRLVDGNQVGAKAVGSQAAFRARSGLLEVRNVGSAEVTIELGRAVPHATIVVGGRVWYTRDGDNLKLFGPVSESTDDSVRFHARS